MKILVVFIAAATLAWCQSGRASAEGNATKGKELFTKYGCYQCHGYAGQGGRSGARVAPMALTSAAMIRYIRQPAGEMPAYTAKVLPDTEATDIWAYLRSFPAPPAVKDIPLLNQMQKKQ